MFSIITPSFRQLDWLKLCAASIADQEGVSLEHIVQDAGGGPEMEEWGATQKGLRLVIEKDKGMYDAINRGLQKGRGGLCAYLNCDEQYLPGTLQRVEEQFALHPEVDVFFGDAHVVGLQGEYFCTRHALLPQKAHTLVSYNLSILTCATFFRRKILDEHQLFFDTAWKDAGDAVWALTLAKKRIPMGLLGFATSVFTDTGENMNLRPNGVVELKKLSALAPWWARHGKPLVVAHHRLRKWLNGHYRGRPLRYEIFTKSSPTKRVGFEVAKSTAVWRSRL